LLIFLAQKFWEKRHIRSHLNAMLFRKAEWLNSVFPLSCIQ
jgi:hypothetical protein